MKIAITADQPTLDASLDPRLGRCAYFLIVDPDSLDFEAVQNPNVALAGGAGIQSAQLIAAKDTKFVLTGNCGPNAQETLSAAGIGVIPGCSGPVRDVIERFKAGQLPGADEPTLNVRSGMAGSGSASEAQHGPSQPRSIPAGGSGTGDGPGAGRGLGRGRGRGPGRGRGRGQRGVGGERGGGRGRGMGD